MQQLAIARAHGSPPAGPPPSELREKLVQTDHTELSQVRVHLDNLNELTDGHLKHFELALVYISVFSLKEAFIFFSFALCVYRPQYTEIYIWRL